ncbi:MAG: alpha/beta hydrolase [Gammaproteobacteria bacterium]|jgi:pimeloyl-ACP methyl ester carboxylesterase|nr:alpha/beta hydrolase [Gammaproteobacteria bacterium]MBT4491891.1 alpha/beta hydrolase [Gammaproteobacteria bacterium]
MYTTVNDHRTFYSTGTRETNPSKPSVIFIHGAGMDHSVWVLPARYFARHGYNVFAFDLPGHGRSDGKPLKAIEGIADWIGNAMDKLDVKEAAIVGHSMGSLTGICFAARYPEKITSLSLLGTSTPMPVTEQLLNAAESNDHDAIDMANTWSHSNFGQQGGNSNPGLCMTMSGQRLLERSSDDVLFTDLKACNDFTEAEDLLDQISVETLIILGREDKMTSPVAGRMVAEKIRNARVVELSPCGHSMMSEQPDAVLDALVTNI